MSLYFQSICSSSSGNCLSLWTNNTRILIDCGLSSMKRTRQILDCQAKVDSILLTHTHSDHISYYPLKVLEEFGYTISIHDDCIDQLKNKHFKEYGFKSLNIKPFKNKRFTVGEFSIKPFEVKHNPYYPTYGYQIYYQDRKIVIVTDFFEWESVFEYFLDADFIFVESNHDLGLLKKFYNPNSQFHMPNPETGNLLFNIMSNSKKTPSSIMLGHISSQRNKHELALMETINTFKEAQKQIDFELLAAPLRQCSEVVKIT